MKLQYTEQLLCLFVQINLALIIILFVFNIKEFSRVFKGIHRRSIIILAFIILLGFSLRTWLAPHAVLMGKYHSYSYLMQTQIPSLKYSEAPMIPPGFPLLYNLLFLILPHNVKTVFYLNVSLGCLSILFIYLLMYLLTDNEKTGLLSAFLLALCPLHIRYSGSELIIISSVFFMLLSMTSFLMYTRQRRKISSFAFLLLGSLSLVYTIYTKMDNMIIIPAIILFLIFFDKNKGYKGITFWFILLIPFILLFPYIMQIISYGFLGHPGYLGMDKFKLFSRALYSPVALIFNNPIFNPYFMPILFSFFFLVGMAFTIFREKRVFFAMISWILTFLTVFSNQPLALSRFEDFSTLYWFIHPLIPFIVVSTFGLNFILDLLSSKRFLVLIKIAILFSISVSPFLHREFIPRRHNVQDEFDFLTSSVKKIPVGCSIIVPTKWNMIYTPGTPPINFSLPLNIFYIQGKSINIYGILYIQDGTISPNNGCVLYYEGLSCYRTLGSIDEITELRSFPLDIHKYKASLLNPVCQAVRDNFILEPFLQETFTNEEFEAYNTNTNTFTIGFYKIKERTINHGEHREHRD